MTTHPNMAWRPFQISAWTDGPHPHAAKSGYSSLQSFTASSNTELATLVLGLTTETVENGQKSMVKMMVNRVADTHHASKQYSNNNHPIVSYIPGDLDSRG
jgi:hypothetical protein